MAFRTIVISTRCKLEYSLNYLIYRSEEEKRIHMSEIETLIIQSTQVSITSNLISEIISRKINLIFCDSKNNPQSQLLPLYGSYDTRKKILEQFAWNDSIKATAWRLIITSKINFQAKLLEKNGHYNEYNKLLEYIDSIDDDDKTNREGHAAKVYFNVIFGNDFSRQSNNIINAYLNYGYSIVLSSINREIVSLGYLTQIGIHHCNDLNEFNLTCDLMEPFRILVDQFVLENDINEDNFKKEMIKITKCKVFIDDMETYYDNAIRIYVQSVISFLNEKNKNIKFPNYYEL